MPHLAPILAIVTAITKAIDIVAPLFEKIFNPDTNKFYETNSKSIKEMRKEDIDKILMKVNSDLDNIDKALTSADKTLADLIDIKTNPIDTAEEAIALAEKLEELVRKINTAKEEGGDLGKLYGSTSEGMTNMAKTLRNVAGDMRHVGMIQNQAPSSPSAGPQPTPGGSVVVTQTNQQTIKT
jgi:paraquat-inducible protein B